MCGITGFIDIKARLNEPEKTLADMARVLHHRGPDDAGTWFDANSGLGLAHARLSIIDLSKGGHQPMVSASGRLVITYNGEIYNFPELRKELVTAGRTFRGHSDTEVLLEGIEHFGLEGMVARCIGMFAFAVWDRESRTLRLVRDRLGIKPLYYAAGTHGLVFGSELKALLASELIEPAIDPASIPSYLRFLYVPAPTSILKGVNKLEPGTIASFSTTEGQNLQEQRTRYWCPVETARAAAADPITTGTTDAIDLLEKTLAQATADRMVSDVPLGAFLSGGIDSSVIVALMQEASATPVKTFTIGFNEAEYDESTSARAIAKHLGTDHNELIVTPKDSLEVIPELAQIFDEPFADASQIPTYIVSRLARTKVTVALSGDGGDELLAGYNRYAEGHRAWKRITSLPRPVGRVMRGGIAAMSPNAWNRMYAFARTLSLGRLGPQPFGDRIHKLAATIGTTDQHEFYRVALSAWMDPSLLTDASEGRTVFDREDLREQGDFTEYMMLADTCSYLVDDILTKVDRASMAVSLEVRVPILDHRVFEVAWRLPHGLRIDGSKGKIALREILARRMPRKLFERPKMGFAVPTDEWLRGPLRDWAESLLQPRDLEAIGLKPGMVRRTWDEHVGGAYNRQTKLWPILMLRAWSDHWGIRV